MADVTRILSDIEQGDPIRRPDRRAENATCTEVKDAPKGAKGN